ncbi:AarF/UbiB family protein [Shigella flexneri]
MASALKWRRFTPRAWKENGEEVVIKVIRPDILPVIRADMKLIYRLARWVPRLFAGWPASACELEVVRGLKNAD